MNPPDMKTLADAFYTPDFAARLANAKLESFQAETEGRDIPVAALAGDLGIPVPIFEMLMAWNVANAHAAAILEAMARARREAPHEARH